jgi:hypothetical protein
MTTLQNSNGQQFNVQLYFSQEFKGRGGWNILCEVTFKEERKTFKIYTTNTHFIDQISEMKADDCTWNEIQNAYKLEAFDELKEEVIEWLEEFVSA